MINFGTPRIGDKAYAAFSDAIFPNQWRVVNNKDIVPHVPSKEWPFEFRHTSTEVHEEDGEYTICGPGEDPECSDRHWKYSPIDHMYYLGKCMGRSCNDFECGRDDQLDQCWWDDGSCEEDSYNLEKLEEKWDSVLSKLESIE